MNTTSLIINDLNYTPLCDLCSESPDRAKNITETHKINNVSTLTFEMSIDSDNFKYLKNENIAEWKDEYYFIKTPQLDHDKTKRAVTVECKHLACSLEGFINEIVNEIGQSCEYLMNKILKCENGISKTGWRVGKVEVGQGKFRALESTDQSVLSNLIKIAELFGGMLVFDSKKKLVHMVDNPTLGTEYQDRDTTISTGLNLKSISLTYDSSELVTMLHVRGGEAEDGSGEISIIEHNPTKKSYIVNYDYFLKQGYKQDYIDAHPELFLREMIWTASEYKDSKALYEDSLKKMKIIGVPKLRASFTGLDLSYLPEYMINTPILGEVITVIDEDLDMEFKARVIGITTTHDKPWEMSIEISNEIDYSSVVKQIMDSTKIVNKVMNLQGTTKGNKIQGAIDVIKAQLISSKSNWYTDKNGNMVFENATKTKAMMLGGGIFGIANSSNKDGSWNWTTFGTGEGFVADCITSGILQGEKVKWDMNKGTFLIGDSVENYSMYYNGSKLMIRGGITIDTLPKEFTKQIDSMSKSIKDTSDTVGKVSQVASSAHTASKSACSTIDKWSYGNTTNIDGGAIQTHTLAFDTCRGGEIKLGGKNQGNGYLGLYDQWDNLKVRMNNGGIELKNGAKLISDGGVLSSFVFQSSGNYLGGWQMCGHFITNRGSSGKMSSYVNGFVPSGFTIKEATLRIKVMNILYNNYQDPLNGTNINGWRTLKKIGVYKAEQANKGYVTTYNQGELDITTMQRDNPQLISHREWGDYWNPSAWENIEERWLNVKDHLQSGQPFRFSATTADGDTSLNNSAFVILQLEIVGFQAK